MKKISIDILKKKIIKLTESGEEGGRRIVFSHERVRRIKKKNV